MESFEKLLEKSTAVHGHICAGQVIGVRMCLLALSRIGIKDPKGSDRKNLYTVVEIDRCATDAIQSVTGCSLGKRSMKYLDHGVMAATFSNLDSKKSVRITALEEARDHAAKYCGDIENKYARQLAAYKVMPDHELFRIEQVSLNIPEEDMPGRPLRRVQCEECSDWVQDNRDVTREGKTLCKGCAHGRYYALVKE